jgi:hypothetical protein
MASGDLSYEQGQIVGARIDDSGQVELRGARTAAWVGLGEHNGSGTEGDRGQCRQLSDGTPPVTSTVSPGRNGALETEWTATAVGSMSAPWVNVIFGERGKT